MPAGRVKSALDELELVSNSYHGAPPPVTQDTKRLRLRAQKHRKVPVVRPGQDTLFRSLWRLNIPIVVRGLYNRMQGSWSPASFVRTHGSQTVLMLRSSGLPSERVSVDRFFQEFTRSDADRGCAVKVKDWPPSASFEDDFKQNYDAFMQAVPMPSYTRYDGMRNLIAHYGIPPPRIASLRPDVGPKVYIATPDLSREGSTRLHLDVASAVNMLPWTSSGNPDETGAEWYIFDPSDLGPLRVYLRTKHGADDQDADPIHAQQTFVDEDMLAELALHGIRPYKIEQRLGDVVFIPAGAAHQVSNVQACIKVACDFLGIDGILESSNIVQDFRRDKLPDVLQLNVVLWDAWASLSFHAAHASQQPQTQGLTRHEMKNKRQRETSRGREDAARRKKHRKTHLHDEHSSAPTDPSQSYRCPFSSCARQPRRFVQLIGLFNHMQVLYSF
ncbi:hypothetical protein L226DRAFT_457378 [Lentinus tigrinus ALCF2SS1-7]|uniref:uncharacterized protein n=1 Tax=Lentinus tigrinus ALCF2SS1-7 TaxID=1328758 RepID=UPI0011662ADD|nr:hypothetical protein L226DRAFT_457378 [Lentinus tigrinus ALCF2SS1-7]